MYPNFRVPGSKAINHNVKKSLKFRVPYVSDSLPQMVELQQGSIMRPVLFILYIKNLFRVPKHCEPLVYVGDSTLLLWVLLQQTLRNLTTLSLQYTKISKKYPYAISICDWIQCKSKQSSIKGIAL